MFEKRKLKRKIDRYKTQIEEVEHKRTRSQSALVEAILTNQVPDDNDVDYFNRYTEQIDTLRAQMREYQNQLEKLKK